MVEDTNEAELPELPELKVKLTKAEKKAKFRTDYPEPIKSRREDLKLEFLGDPETKEQRIRDLSFKYFDEDLENGCNIFGSVIEHFKAMPDRTKWIEKNNLTNIYLNSFKQWLEENQNKEELKKKYLTREIQCQAIMSCSGVSQYCELMCSLFDLSVGEFSTFIIDDIKNKLNKLDFKEAADNAIFYKVKENFTFDEMILPLLLQDKLQISYEYMRGMPKLQREFVKWHDHFIEKSDISVEAELEQLRYNGKKFMTVNPRKFCGKTLEKYMNSIFNKIAEEYDFDILCSRDAPEFESKKHKKALKHLVSSRYDLCPKNKSTDAVYFQYVRSTLEQCKPKEIEEFLFYLFSSREEEKHVDALSWFKLRKLNIYSEEVPGRMRDYLRSGTNLPLMEMAEELLKSRISLELPEIGTQLYLFEEKKEIPIFLIENDAGLDHFCSELKFYENDDNVIDKYIGIDTEWKPAHLIQSTAMKIAIMQIYFDNKVHIVDCCKLENDRTIRDETWKKFAKRLLCSDKFKVIGFDLKNDLDALLSIKPLKETITLDDVKNVYCLKRLTENICEIDMEILDLIRKTFKLADLAEKFLGISLDKTEQCSSWQSRPLRKNQIVYAAMDSYVVVAIYSKIFDILREKNVDISIDDVLNESNVFAPKKEKTKRVNKKIETLTWIEIYEALKDHRNCKKPLLRPFDVKCIVDTMLLGFGKYLKRCGVDVLIPYDVHDFHEKLKTMQRVGGAEMRYILTVPSKSYDALRSQYPDITMKFPDITAKSALDQLRMFFDEFNLDIRPDDICLRCMDCNSVHLVRFPSPVVHFLHQYFIIHLQNVYRSNMSEFPIETWCRKMEEINPEEYQGIDVTIQRPKENSDWVVAKTLEGSLHITRNILVHNKCAEGVEVRINKVPDDAFQRPNLVFYICGECGRVNYDGRKVNPSSKSDTSASNSNESVIENAN